jgi:hypothetical protein
LANGIGTGAHKKDNLVPDRHTKDRAKELGYADAAMVRSEYVNTADAKKFAGKNVKDKENSPVVYGIVKTVNDYLNPTGADAKEQHSKPDKPDVRHFPLN